MKKSVFTFTKKIFIEQRRNSISKSVLSVLLYKKYWLLKCEIKSWFGREFIHCKYLKKGRAKRYNSFSESTANFEWYEKHSKRFSNFSTKSTQRSLSIQASSNCQPDIWGGQRPLLHHRPTPAHRRYVQNWRQYHWYRF